MLKIRLARVGKKKQPTYRFIVNESARDMYGKALEILGYYNPFSKVIDVKRDRVLYWISQGAQLSPTVHNLLVDQNVIDKEKIKASKAKKKKGSNEPVATPEATPAPVKNEESNTVTEDAEAKEEGIPAKIEELKPAEETPNPDVDKKEDPTAIAK